MLVKHRPKSVDQKMFGLLYFVDLRLMTNLLQNIQKCLPTPDTFYFVSLGLSFASCLSRFVKKTRTLCVQTLASKIEAINLYFILVGGKRRKRTSALCVPTLVLLIYVSGDLLCLVWFNPQMNHFTTLENVVIHLIFPHSHWCNESLLPIGPPNIYIYVYLKQ